MSGMKKQASRGVFWSLAENIGTLGISFLTFLVLARLLEKEAFGLVALAMAYILFLELFIRSGIIEVIIQRRSLSDLDMNTAFWAAATLGVIALLISLLLAPFASVLSGENELESILYWLSLGILPLSLSSVQSGIMVREMRFRGLAARRIIGVGSGAIVGIICALNGLGVWSLVAQLLTHRVADFLTLYWVTRWFPKFEFSWQALRDMADYGSKVIGANVAYYAGSQVDRVLIGYFLGVATLGVYVVGQKLTEILFAMMNGVVGRVALASFSKFQTDTERLGRASLSVGQLTAITALPVFTFLALAAIDITQAIFGDKWSDSAAVTRVLAIAAIARTCFVFLIPALKAKGMAGRVMTAIVLQAATSISFAILLSPFGLIAMTIGWSTGYLASAAVLIYFVGNTIAIKLTDLIQIYAVPLLSAIIAAVLLYFLAEPLIKPHYSIYLAVTVKLCIFIVGYLGSLIVLSPRALKSAYTDISSLLFGR